MTSSPSAGWTILVPIKATARGKSRLDLPGGLRQRLALAMAMDTITAAGQCGAVLAIMEDEDDAAAVASIVGVRVHLTSVSGLNESIRDGLKVLPGLSGARESGPVAVLPGDLPGLLAVELSAALDRCRVQPFAVVADHQGVGSTLLTATRIAALVPQYGPDSFRRHRESGAVSIELPIGSSLRWDIDTVADLATGLGPFTAAALDRANGRPRR